MSNFEKLEICYLGPDSLAEKERRAGKKKWEGILFEGSWRKRVNAGGCRNYICVWCSGGVVLVVWC